MKHYCRLCGTPRECGCGDPCGEPIRETCKECNNEKVLDEIMKKLKNKKMKINELGMDPLGGYHIK